MIIEGKEYEIRLKGETYHCALDVTMHFIGGKWKTVVLWYLRNGRKRFSELKRHIPDITEKMLSLQLKQLEADGFVGKTIYRKCRPAWSIS
jgi:DNA-binding HxlR family transcriptional regulator